ncbi:putative helicase mov-10-B [Scleropages formosus]|uniref:RNA helicase n=1 Tax=Scleropages formosus TaxID=113540 RepID=A0A0P7UK81_SCLFO|nr:putative helicase mov-10-B [Scleropages formosus]
MASLKARLRIGLEFIEFLGERRSNTNKDELKKIYDEEFRNRNGVKEPAFSSVVYALKCSDKVFTKGKKVYLNTQVRILSGDQWQRTRHKQKPANEPGRSCASSGSSASAVPPPDPSSTARAASEPTSRSVRKRVKAIIRGLHENRQHYISDKEGIVITSDHNIKNGKIKITTQSIQMTYVVKLNIQNKAGGSIHFTLYTFLCRMCCFSLQDEKKVTPACPILLNPGDSYEVEVHFRSSQFGYFPATLVFEFRPCTQGNSKLIHIVRDIEATLQTPLAKDLGPTAPYKPYKAPVSQPVHTIVEEGFPPERLVVQQLKDMVSLGLYKYPPFLKLLVKERLQDSDNLQPTVRKKLPSVKALLEAPLDAKRYAERFELLLHLEKLQMEVDIKRYDMQGQLMTRDRRNQRLLVLKVPGVAENRPSVLTGDHLMVSRAEDKGKPITMYKGYVHRVELEQVKLGFSIKLLQNFVDNMKFNVEFTLNCFPLRLQHRAVQLAIRHQLGPVLFPSATSGWGSSLPELRLYDRKLENNPEQCAAVRHILSGVSKPAPYLVFGPPGTGKTVTIVEAIKQVRKLDPQARVLACAPSNSASDLLCERVREHGDGHTVFRLYAGSRDPGSVPTALLNCCNLDKSNGCFVLPSKNTLMEYKVLVSTLVTAGSHIFIDEAGHAMEPECIIAVAGLLQPGTGQLVLAGDPKQLGPILRSPLAIQHGLGLSLLERLMLDNPLYQKAKPKGAYDEHFVSKLLHNYRSHPAILRIPNELFYDGELQVFADHHLRESCCTWEHLPKKDFPVVFHGAMGRDEREANSPSFFNVTEIHILMDYLKKLLQTQGKKGLATLSPKEIGIITPYRKQVEKINKAIRIDKELNQLKNIKELKVGSVEEFQGQERKVIMVSTVRSSATYVKMDKEFNLGFLTNEKRFNVAMTRAKALLIVVGNPVILNKDLIWKRFIHYCKAEGGYTGFDYADIEEEDDLVTRLAALNIQEDAEGGCAASLLGHQVYCGMLLCQSVSISLHGQAANGPTALSQESLIQQYMEPQWRNEQ